LAGTGAEGYAELIKSFHALSSINGNTTLTSQQYNVAQTATLGWTLCPPPANTATTIGTHYSAFAVGLELQSFSNRSDTILSGISTLNSQVYFTGVINTGQTAVANQTLDFFAMMDMILVIQDGIMSAKF